MMKTTLFPTKNFSIRNLGFMLQKCMKSKALKQGKQVHGLLLTTAPDLEILSLNSQLVGIYASCGDLKSAGFVFDKVRMPNVFAVNWMVLASAYNGSFVQAIGYFSLIKNYLSLCNKFTFSILLKTCVGLLDFNKGNEIHAVATTMGFVCDKSVANGLIDMYSKCGKVYYAQKVFDKMPERDVASWTSLICGYCNIGKIENAISLFERMKLGGIEPNDFTWNAMISGFARRGDCNRAFALFSRMTREGLVPDLVTWNAIISGFSQSQKATEAIKLFCEMLVLGIKPNNVTITGLLPAFGLMGSIQRGKEIHGLVFRMGLDVNVFVASALIDMYSKCGSVKDAKTVFDVVHDKNVVTYNAMIGCYGKHGLVELSVDLFKVLNKEGITPNEVTFISFLSACSHGGLVEKGLEIFKSMKESYGVEILKEHYACVVDMLCRSGRNMEAYEMMREVPMGITNSIAGSFLNGCTIYDKRDLAKKLAMEILRMDLKRPGGFVTLSNIYAADGEWNGVELVRMVMKKKNISKEPGLSLVEKRDEFVQKEVEKESSKWKIERGDLRVVIERNEESKDIEAVGVGS